MKHLRKIVLAVFLASSFSPQPAKAEPIIIGIITAAAAAIGSAIVYEAGRNAGQAESKETSKEEGTGWLLWLTFASFLATVGVIPTVPNIWAWWKRRQEGR